MKRYLPHETNTPILRPINWFCIIVLIVVIVLGVTGIGRGEDDFEFVYPPGSCGDPQYATGGCVPINTFHGQFYRYMNHIRYPELEHQHDVMAPMKVKAKIYNFYQDRYLGYIHIEDYVDEFGTYTLTVPDGLYFKFEVWIYGEKQLNTLGDDGKLLPSDTLIYSGDMFDDVVKDKLDIYIDDPSFDISGDFRMGLPECTYCLQVVSGLR